MFLTALDECSRDNLEFVKDKAIKVRRCGPAAGSSAAPAACVSTHSRPASAAPSESQRPRAHMPAHDATRPGAAPNRRERPHASAVQAQCMYDLLVSKPEGEAKLLTALVNKLGDPSRKLASKTGFLLAQLLMAHPRMKPIVAREVSAPSLPPSASRPTPPRHPHPLRSPRVAPCARPLPARLSCSKRRCARDDGAGAWVAQVERFLFRPGLQDRARYYAVVFLNQIPLTHKVSASPLRRGARRGALAASRGSVPDGGQRCVGPCTACDASCASGRSGPGRPVHRSPLRPPRHAHSSRVETLRVVERLAAGRGGRPGAGAQAD